MCTTGNEMVWKCYLLGGQECCINSWETHPTSGAEQSEKRRCCHCAERPCYSCMEDRRRAVEDLGVEVDQGDAGYWEERL